MRRVWLTVFYIGWFAGLTALWGWLIMLAVGGMYSVGVFDDTVGYGAGCTLGAGLVAVASAGGYLQPRLARWSR